MITANESVIAECASCGHPFGGAPPRTGAQVVLAKCSYCVRRYYVSTFTELTEGTILGHKAALGFLPNRHLSGNRTTDIEKLLGSQRDALQEFERRDKPRYKSEKPVIVVPLNGEFRSTAPAFDATCIDISGGGLSFKVNSKSGASYWLIDFISTLKFSAQFMIKIVRMEPLGGG